MDVRLPQRPYCRYRHLQYDSYDPLAQVRDWTTEDGESRQETNYFHCDQIGIPREMTDDEGKLVSFLQKKIKILVVFPDIPPEEWQEDTEFEKFEDWLENLMKEKLEEI